RVGDEHMGRFVREELNRVGVDTQCLLSDRDRLTALVILGIKDPADGRKVKGVIHWVSAAHALPIEIRLYDRLFSVPNPGAAE
ncbi:hypothetical protein ONQ97_28225, partial [Salmonella enterica subsp. enterica serovar Virginia]|nr:hypothetical protein [Salmonella enterica subsp. enterica serovar Virginia]